MKMGSKTASRIAGMKLSGIVVAFLMPILVLGYFLSAQLRNDIDFTFRALDGVAFNRLVMPILLNASGGRNKPPDNDFLLQQGGTLARSLDLVREYDSLAALISSADPDPSAVMDAAMDLVVQSAGKTNLVVDPSPETNFLASVLAGGLPEVLRDYQYTSRMFLAAASKPAGSAAHDDLLLSIGKLKGSIERVRRGLEGARATSGNKTDYDKAIKNAEDISLSVAPLVDIPRQGGPDSIAFPNSIGNTQIWLAERITSRIKKIWLVTVSRHGAALALRNEELRRSLITILVLSVAACILGLGAAVTMFRSTLKKLDEVGAAKEVAERARREADQMTERLSEINEDIASLNGELSSNMGKLREAQDEIVRKGKLSQLGQLTATVAHELRNPLGAVRTSAFMLERKLKDKALGIEPQLERINNGVKRCDDIITQLLDFTRSSALTLKEAELDGWLTKLLEDEVEELPSAISVEFSPGIAGLSVAFDGERLQRAVINLLSNAAEALVGKGHGPSKFANSDPRIAVTTRRSTKGVEIAVEDNGPGIAEETMKRILEPLFTTKNFGTGLGLPAVEKIMDLHGGGLEIASKPGEGACFTLWLPVS